MVWRSWRPSFWKRSDDGDHSFEAGDPASGSAAMMEIIRSFGEMIKHGWKPLRTIIVASWDGEEYGTVICVTTGIIHPADRAACLGLVGSTEWVEEYRPYLMKNCVAYLNVDVATSGSSFTTAA